VELDTNCLIDRIQAVKLSAIDYWLWYSMTVKEWVMYVKYLQHIKWEIFIYKFKENEPLREENFYPGTFM